MDKMFNSNSEAGTHSHDSKHTPNVLKRACVALAQSCGWLSPIDGAIVAEFRRQHPVLGIGKEKKPKQ